MENKQPVGRPPFLGSRMVTLSIRVTAEQAERLREIGGGNASAGVRELLAQSRPKR